MKCGAETCWQEVSVDCEGPNREDREGLRYSLTYFDCLSHAVLLEPMRSLTHSEVRRAFVRCVLRSRTMPSLVRSDRAASSARKLDKAGYSLQERTALVAPTRDVCGGLDLADALSKILVAEDGPQAPASVELLSVKKRADAHLPKDCLDILEVSWGEPVLSRAARLKGYSVGPAVVHGDRAYAVQWDLLKCGRCRYAGPLEA